MYKFSTASQRHRETLDARLQIILIEAIEIFDFAIVCGHRNEADQNKAHETKRSKLRWPKSKHNSFLSKAVDIVPYPIEWPDKEKQTKEEYARRLGRFYHLAGIIKAVAFEKGIEIIWGGDWPKFKDLGHFEIKEA